MCVCVCARARACVGQVWDLGSLACIQTFVADAEINGIKNYLRLSHKNMIVAANNRRFQEFAFSYSNTPELTDDEGIVCAIYNEVSVCLCNGLRLIEQPLQPATTVPAHAGRGAHDANAACRAPARTLFSRMPRALLLIFCLAVASPRRRR